MKLLLILLGVLFLISCEDNKCNPSDFYIGYNEQRRKDNVVEIPNSWIYNITIDSGYQVASASKREFASVRNVKALLPFESSEPFYFEKIIYFIDTDCPSWEEDIFINPIDQNSYESVKIITPFLSGTEGYKSPSDRVGIYFYDKDSMSFKDTTTLLVNGENTITYDSAIALVKKWKLLPPAGSGL